MSLAEIEKAVDSLDGYHGAIGIMGGEPTLHPDFPAICEMLLKKVSPWKLGIWTSGHKWDEYKKIIKKTFKFCCSYNDHSSPEQKHQPVLVAIDDVVDDKKLMRGLIDKCWVQEAWSPSINHKGAFFCEVAAAMDIVFNGPGGYPVEQGWWEKTPEQFRDQVDRYCLRCGAALPMECPSNREAADLVSPGNLEMLKKVNSPKIARGKYILFDRKLDPDTIMKKKKSWNPGAYLGVNFVLGFLIGFVNEFSRKKNLKLDEWWLLFRGSYSFYRIWYRFRRLFERNP